MPYCTADFSEFRKKVEPFFGSLEELAENNPGFYAHKVLSHGFMEYCCATGMPDRMDKTEPGYSQQLKEKYLTWARKNNLAENLLEKGWQEYLND